MRRGIRLLSQSAPRGALEAEIAAANARTQGRVRIEPRGQAGHGLVAVRPAARGDLLFRATALSEHPTRNSHSVQTGPDRHVNMDLPARLINHCCHATVGARSNALGAFDFFALQDIAEGEELLWDYETAEYEVSVEFEPAPVEGRPCGGPGCRGKLRGFKHHGPEVRARYGDYIADYLREQA